ncbi:MAG: DUF4251 domain-containing protein [Tannerellaceae bacterium]|nr:DUF4251 domain-containing protein [Tannerellaceae bacterium]
MNRFKLLCMLGIALLTGGQSLLAQGERKEEKVRELIESNRFTIQIDRAVPMQGRAVNLTSTYSLELKGDSVISYLPYFGRAYNVPYGGGEGLQFEEEVTDRDLSFNKKGIAEIKFSARTKEDRYTFHVQIFSNGSATVNVNPVNRQNITYYGQLITDRKE